MKIERDSRYPGEYSRPTVIVSAEQFTSDIAAAYAAGEDVEWSNVEDTNYLGDETIFYTVVVTHDEGYTTYNWEESL